MNVRKTGLWQRALALVLCALMLASIVPAGAFAAQADGGAYTGYAQGEVIAETGPVSTEAVDPNIIVQAVGWNDNDGRDGFVGPNISEANKDNNVKTETVAESDIDFNLYNYSYMINTDGAGNRRKAADTGAYFFSPGGHNLFPDAEAARDLANADFYDHALYGFSKASNTGWELFQENNMARNLYYDQYTGEYYPMLGSNRTNRNNGQAVLDEDQAKLGYLYGGTDYVAGDGTQKADASLVMAYEDIPQTPLHLTEDGYYVYNSALNAADYLVDKNELIVRGYKERTEQSANVAHLFENHTSAVADFLPFNSVHDTVDQYAIHGNGNGYRFYYKDQIDESGSSSAVADALPFADYWFGATMDFDFVQAPGGVWNGKDVVYEFSGDDDVMVYLDGKLVLDMSGNHKRISGTINFNTGLVEAYLDAQGAFGSVGEWPIAYASNSVTVDSVRNKVKGDAAATLSKINENIWTKDERRALITSLLTTGYNGYTGFTNLTEVKQMHTDGDLGNYALSHRDLAIRIRNEDPNAIKYDLDGLKRNFVNNGITEKLFDAISGTDGYPYFENKHAWYWYKYPRNDAKFLEAQHIKIEYHATTVYDCYKLALREAGLTETEAKAELDKIFEPTGETVKDALGRSYPVYRFRDYSKHSFNWFYQERFAGASNFSVKFNLPTIPANSLVIGKELDYVNEDGTSAASSPALEQTLTYSFRVLETDEAGTVAADIGTDGLMVTPGTQYKIYEDFANTGEVGIVDEEGCIHLKPGQQAVVDQLIETYGNDTYYVVEELIPEEFSAQYGDVILSGGEKDTVEIRDENGDLLYRGYRTGVQNTGAEKERMVNIFTNQIRVTKLSSFELTKVLDPEAEQLLKDETFTFEVLLGGTRLAPGTGYTVGAEHRKTDANGYITLKQNETARLEGIISGTAFQVREVYKAFSDYEAVFTGNTLDENNTSQKLEASTDVISGRIPLHGSVRVTATNQIRPGALENDKYVEATNDANEFVLTLEAYARGQLKEMTKPADIVLVLDHSGSMRTPVGATEVLKSGTRYTGGGEVPRSQISVEKAKHRGYYVAQSTATNSWFVMEYDEDFQLNDGTTAERWVGYLVPTTESIVDTTPGNYTEHTMTLSWVPSSVDANLVFYKSQYAVLYDALLEFVGDLKDSGTAHNVSIVGFAGSESWGTRLYVGGDETAYKYYQDHLYHDNTTQARREELYRKSMKNVQDPAEYAELISNINAIETNHSFTCPTAGLQLANEVFAANAVSMAERDRIVVLFTDGIPNRQMGENEGIDVDDAKQDAIYDEIVRKANETKNTYGAQVYSICTTTVTGSRDFLNFASSNYPNAVGYNTPGTEASEQYYHEIEDFETLSNVFKTVTASATSVELDGTAVLEEVLTDYFVLNPNTEVDVRMYTSAYNGDGTFAAPVEKTEKDGFRYVLSSSEGTDRMDTVDVTGFPYKDEYVSNVPRIKDGKPYYGSKLIVKVQIRTRDGFWGGNNVPTNEETTGIYDKNRVPVADFPEPEVNVPVDVKVTAKDKTIYYSGDVTARELLERVTAGGMDVTVNDDGTFTPAEDWMDDYADLSWTDDSTRPGDTPDNTDPDDYTFEVRLEPKYDGTRNRQDEPGNIAGNVDGGEIKPGDLVAPSDTDASTGHVYILVPELTFRDSVTEFGTAADGYDYNGKDYVSDETRWVNMETDLPEGTVVPPVSGTEPELELTYTPEDNADQFVGDTKVEVTVSVAGKPDLDISSVTIFKWNDCTHQQEHGSCGVVNTHAGDADAHEFWVHTTISILPDTVVIDYGLPVLIDPLTNDLHGYDIVTEKILNGIGDAFGTSHTGVFGAAAMEGSEVRYTLNTSNGMQMDVEETFPYQGAYTIKGREYTAESTITVIPATIIYYEDSFLDYKVYDYNTDEELTDRSWETVAGEVAIQDTDRPGTDQIGRDLNDLYGYDSNYTDEGGYSLESYHKITVDANTYGKATFTFTGTAFDVIALSGGTTGTITVAVYNGTGPLDRTNRVCNHMVDTYYGYTYQDGEWVITDPTNPNALYQVPVMKVDMADHVSDNNGYGTYTAVITVSYDDMFDHEQYAEAKYDFMLDAIRIYDQANDGQGNEVIENAYKADGEGWPTYTELRNILIDANTFDSLGEDDAATGIVFIDGIPALDDGSASGSGSDVSDDLGEDAAAAIRDYANFGPNNELYLASGQGVAFYLDVPGNVQNVHLALKSVGGTAGVRVCGVDADGTRTYALGTESAAGDIATATDLYYDITGLKNKTVVIASSGDAILSVTNIKMTHSSKPAVSAGQTEQELAAERFQVSREIAELALNALKPAPVNPFADVFEGDYYYESILWAVRKGITNGVDASHFAPAGNCNRAQVVTFLWRAAGCPEPNASKHPFVDVDADSFYYKAMLWAVEKGITNGVDATHFDPTGVCNRAQVVTFLWRAAGCPEAERTEHPFEDVMDGSFYHKATLWAVEKGITNGMTATSFAPTLTCTRGQVVTFLYRAYTR